MGCVAWMSGLKPRTCQRQEQVAYAWALRVGGGDAEAVGGAFGETHEVLLGAEALGGFVVA